MILKEFIHLNQILRFHIVDLEKFPNFLDFESKNIFNPKIKFEWNCDSGSVELLIFKFERPSSDNL